MTWCPENPNMPRALEWRTSKRLDWKSYGLKSYRNPKHRKLVQHVCTYEEYKIPKSTKERKHEVEPHAYFPSKLTWKSPFHKNSKEFIWLNHLLQRLSYREIWYRIYFSSIPKGPYYIWDHDGNCMGVLISTWLKYGWPNNAKKHAVSQWGRKKRLEDLVQQPTCNTTWNHVRCGFFFSFPSVFLAILLKRTAMVPWDQSLPKMMREPARSPIACCQCCCCCFPRSPIVVARGCSFRPPHHCCVDLSQTLVWSSLSSLPLLL